jgi:hypothetical protein
VSNVNTEARNSTCPISDKYYRSMVSGQSFRPGQGGSSSTVKCCPRTANSAAASYYQASEATAATHPRRSTPDRPARAYLRNHILPRWGDIALGDITALDVTTWLKQLRMHYAASTVRTIRSVFSMLLEDAVEQRLIPMSPMHHHRRRGRRRDHAPSRVEKVFAMPEREPGIPRPGKVAKSRVRRRPRPDDIDTVVKLGFRMGPALHEARARWKRIQHQPSSPDTGEHGVRPHQKKAHSRTYWTGAGRVEPIVRSIAPPWLNGGLLRPASEPDTTSEEQTMTAQLNGVSWGDKIMSRGTSIDLQACPSASHRLLVRRRQTKWRHVRRQSA